jgi:hypothetical protein
VNAPTLVGEAFRRRYAIRRFRDGGVLVDLTTGTYLRLNTSATDVCSALIDSEDFNAASVELVRRFGGSRDAADRAIGDVMNGLSRFGPRREPLGSYRYLPADGGGYILTSNGVARLSVSVDGTSVQLTSPKERLTTAQIFGYLRSVAPKVLFLQSTVVIHGAASRVRNGVRVISGESGAGKTTTARAFGEVGAELLAEDMLVVASASPLRVYGAGEKAIDAWSARSAEELTRDPNQRIDASTLLISEWGEPAPVSEIWFIDGARRGRSGEAILPKRLGETDGALAAMTGLFLGGASPEDWRTFLGLVGEMASSVAIFEALMPSGLDALAAAVKSYTENSAS